MKPKSYWAFFIIFPFLFLIVLPFAVAPSEVCPSTYKWPTPSALNAGQVFFVECSNHEFLSDGTLLYPCEWTGYTKTIQDGHQYICTKAGAGGWAECCGPDTCLKGAGGTGKTTGQSITYTQGQQFILPPQTVVVAEAGEATFTSSGSWQVPGGVNSVTVTLVGGGGAGSGGSAGENGAVYTTAVLVDPGQSYSIVVGQGGKIAPNGKGNTQPSCGSNGGIHIADTGPGGAGGAGYSNGADGAKGAGCSNSYWNYQGFGGGGGGSTSFASYAAAGGTGGKGGCGSGGCSENGGAGGTGDGSKTEGRPSQSPGAGLGGAGGTSSYADGGNGFVKITWSQVTRSLPLSTTPPPASPGTGTATFYCTAQKTFVEDLDSNQAGCTAAGFTWTGSHCCREPEEPNEKYEDATGCWYGHTVTSVSMVTEPKSIVFHNRKFKGCTKNEQDANSLALIKDDFTGNSLIMPQQFCTNINDQYFCSTAGEWKTYPGYAITQKYIPDATPPGGVQANERGSECCGATQCWNGTLCISDQSALVTAANARGTHRCINGNWLPRTPQQALDKSNGVPAGFCPEESDCLVKTDRAPPCISNHQYTGNDLCMEGSWTTRTRSVALAMLSLKGGGPYTLYCDIPEKALAQGPIKHSSTTSSYVGSNPACVMNAGSTLVGLSLNSMPTPEGMYVLLKDANCGDAEIEDGNFHPCEGAPVLFNKKLMSFVYGTEPLEVDSVPFEQTEENSLSPTILSRLKSILSAIALKWGQYFSSFSTRAYRGDPNYNSINKTLAFDKLYMSKTGGANERSVFGYYKTEGSTHHAVIRYTNFEDDICAMVDSYKETKPDVFSPTRIAGIGCFEESDNNYVILMQGKPSSQATFDYDRENEIGKAWEDFTVKLRVS